MFTGKELDAEFIQRVINSPVNAINLEWNAHVTMDKQLAWGIEAQLTNNNEVRVMRLRGIADPDVT